MKTSIMDKIRILRSNRRKTDPKKGKAPIPPPVVSACPLQPPPPQPPQSPEATQQWVPVLVLDISQSNTSPVASTIPVAYSTTTTNNNNNNNNNVQNITIKNSILVKKTVPVTSCPIPGDIPVTKSNLILRCNNPDPKQSMITPIEPVVDPASPSPTHQPSTEQPTEQHEKTDQEGAENHVKCVLCDKSYPSLKDMQTHYLSTHKSRRGKDGRKSKVSTDSLTSQVGGDGEQCSLEQDKGEPALPVSDKGEVDPKCPVCSIDFPSAEEVKTHMKEVHSYVCSECSSTFYTLFQFTSHKCTKVSKKVRRVRKKGGGSMATKQTLKPEVAKIMNRFVQIQPKTKKNIKASSSKSQNSPPPPLLERIQQPQPLPMIAIMNDTEQNHTQENVNEEIISVCGLIACPAAESNETTPQPKPVVDNKKGFLAEEEPPFLPSITTTYSLKTPNTCNSDDEQSMCQKKIPVLETRNLEQAKQLLKNSADVPEAKVPRKELIMEKIAQLRRNPHVSLSWRPTLHVRSQMEEDEEYVCGRCNVLCDDMEDYMDHLQDCLTMTSVTLEPAPNPPRRLLKLPCETATFGSYESGHNRYMINQNLLSKLQAFFPNPLSQPHHFKLPTVAPATLTGQTFRDLLDDDFGYESHESVDMHTAGSASPVSPATRLSEATHSPRDPVAGQGGAGQGRACVGTTTKGSAQPMVMIPVDSKAKIHLNIAPDHQLLKRPGKCQGGGEMVPACSSPGQAASPLGLLLDQDDIKMEVEEEVVEDHFEDS